MRFESKITGYDYDVINADGWITIRWNDGDGVECFTSPTRAHDLTPQHLADERDFDAILAEIGTMKTTPAAERGQERPTMQTTETTARRLPPSSRRRPEEYEEALLTWQASRSATDLADFLWRTSYASDLREEVRAHLIRAHRPAPADDLLEAIRTADRVTLEIPGGGLHGFMEVWAVAWSLSALALSTGDRTDAEAAIAHLDACGARSLDRIRSAVFAA